MKNIGLMMTYNEEDMIEEVMESCHKHFDAIFVLDGSSDRTEEIIRSYDNVQYFIRDQDLFPRRKIYDGARQFLLEKAQEMYGYEGWFTLLHGDEILVDDPNEVVKRAEHVGAERVNWHALNFFLHTSQSAHYDPSKRIQDQVVFYSPGGLEIRQFKNKKGIHYNLNQISNVLPCGVGWKMLLDFPIFKHYVIRSLRQKMKKPVGGFGIVREESTQRLGGNVVFDPSELFVDKLDETYKQVREYKGSFEEFEPANRPPFLQQWLNWRKYREVNWGVLEPLRQKWKNR
ncbi:MAG: glycosyltransferase [Candidatus Margulisiibacteriota bacterium]